jgi:hypothetical protein
MFFTFPEDAREMPSSRPWSSVSRSGSSGISAAMVLLPTIMCQSPSINRECRGLAWAAAA